MGIRRIWNKAAASAALLGSLHAGFLPGAFAAPDDIRLRTVRSEADPAQVLPLREKAVAGSIFDVQDYLRAEMEAAYPELQGTLVFMPYRADGSYLIDADQFADQVVGQFHRSAVGRKIDTENTADAKHIDDVMRNDAKRLFGAEQSGRHWAGSLGYKNWRQMVVPVGMGDTYYQFSIIGLRDECESCVQVKPSAAGQCRSSHPDAVLEERANRLNVAFHELGHKLAEYRNLAGNKYSSPHDAHIDEVRQDVFGTLMEIRLFGKGRMPRMLAMPDTSAGGGKAHLYFDPRAFAAAYSWVQEVGVDKLQEMSLAEVFEQSNVLVTGSVLSGIEVRQLAEHIARIPADRRDIPKAEKQRAQRLRLGRIRDYQRQLAGGQVPGSVRVEGKRIPYSNIAYQFDLARVRAERVGGSPYNNQLAGANPLRPPALQGNQAGGYNRASKVQVDALNGFNRRLYGDQACIARVSPKASVIKTDLSP